MRTGNTGKEMVGTEALEPWGTEGLIGEPVAAATMVGENLTIVSEEHQVMREIKIGAGILCNKHWSHAAKDGSMARLRVWLLGSVV